MSKKAVLVLVPQFLRASYYFNPEAEKLIFSEFLLQEVFSGYTNYEDHCKKIYFLREYIQDNCPFLVEHVSMESWGFLSKFRIEAVPSPSSFMILDGGVILKVSSGITTPPPYHRIWHV